MYNCKIDYTIEKKNLRMAFSTQKGGAGKTTLTMQVLHIYIT